MSQQLDLAFCCDCTGSMASYIRSAQDNIRAISQQIHDKAKASVRYALVKYRDHPPQDSTFATEVYGFTESIDVMKRNVDTMSASGGGDGPESVCCALHEVLSLEWRPNATKVCVLISDAPPHGLGEGGDGFPQGCPLGKDPLVICRNLAALGVVVYAVAVEPILSTQYKFARDFMISVAKTTQGKFLPLGKAEILAAVVVNGALEGLNMDEVWAKMQQEVDAEAVNAKRTLTEHERHQEVTRKMECAAPGMVSAQVDVANPYYDARYDHHNCDAMMGAPSLSSARGRMDACRNSYVQRETAAFEWRAQEARCAPQPMHKSQVERCKTKKGKMMGLE